MTPIALLALASCGGGGGGGTTPTATPVVAPSTAPTGVTATTKCSAINLSWTAVAGATGYNVYHAESAPAATVTQTLVNTNSYTDAGLKQNTTYNYRVAAVNSAGEGPKSATVAQLTGAVCLNVGGSIQGGDLSGVSKVTTLAGSVGKNLLVDGTGANAQFNTPAGIATDGTNLYVADTLNNAIRKIFISTGAVTTIATGLNGPQGITIDTSNNLYVADTQSGKIFAISASGVKSTVSSGFNNPAAITFDGTNLYVANSGAGTIVQLKTDGSASSVLATLTSPQGITSDGTYIYATDGADIFKIPTAGGAASLLATASGNTPQGITSDGTNLFISNTTDQTILELPGSVIGSFTAIAGSAGIPGSADGTGTAARFNHPNGITTDGINLYVVDTTNDTIRKIQ